MNSSIRLLAAFIGVIALSCSSDLNSHGSGATKCMATSSYYNSLDILVSESPRYEVCCEKCSGIEEGASRIVRTNFFDVNGNVKGCSLWTYYTVAGVADSDLCVIIPPTITGTLFDASAFVGSKTSFTVYATGTALSYQWQKNGVSIYNGKSVTYETPKLTMADSGSYYRCIVSRECIFVSVNSSCHS
jgi:hypothetical protein